MTKSVEALLAEAARASSEGRPEAAIASYEAIIAQEPENPRALNALGNAALRKGEVARARAFFERATAQDPTAPALWLNLAVAAKAGGDARAELAALDRALAADPYSVLALLQKAQCLEGLGDLANAVRAYSALLACVPPNATMAPALKAAVDHGRTLVDRHKQGLEERAREAVAGLGTSSHRFDYCLEVMSGRKKIYHPQPSGLHFPYLPAVPFFGRDQFPWFDELEAGTDLLREELVAVIEQDSGFRPYVALAPGQPVNQWSELNHSLNWSAFFLWENGVRNEENIARCPASAALLDRLPLLDIPGRGPTVMFSLLKPGAHIPPHTGVTNIRAVVHLPLVVPQGCAFRVGPETREWETGKAWAFDDTIEHEAWNKSAEVRAILIVDAWNPYLSEEERGLLRIASQAMAGGV